MNCYLATGLATKFSQPQTILKAVLDWTGGQPFLTQKLCNLILSAGSTPEAGQEIAWVGELVEQQIIYNWESQDNPEHLKTIRDRLIHSGEKRTGRLLGTYQHILVQGHLKADGSDEQLQLQLTGLVVKRSRDLVIYNPIDAAVFNREWLNRALTDLRPYTDAIVAWLASGEQDESRLLREQSRV